MTDHWEHLERFDIHPIITQVIGDHLTIVIAELFLCRMKLGLTDSDNV